MRIFVLVVLIFSFLNSTAQQPDTLRLKAEMKIGQQGFTGKSSIITFKNLPETSTWKETEKEISGVPEDWEEFYRKSIWFQGPQVAYQNFIAGNLDTATMAELMESWRFDTADGFSKDWVASYTTVLFRKNEKGIVECLIDTDTDHDFSDEEIRQPFENITYRNIDSLINYTQWVHYQLSVDGVLIEDSVPLLIEQAKMRQIGTYLTYHIPLYGQAHIGNDTLIINFPNPGFSAFTVRLPAQESRSQEKWKKNNRMQLGENWYHIEDFDRAKEELILKMIDPKRDTIAPQEGFYAPGFTLNGLDSSEEFSLSDFRGKYVLLDFWGTWCAPCVGGIPDLVDLNEDLQTEDFELVSVAWQSEPEDIKKLMKEKGMDWHQLMGSSEMLSDYNVNKYPTFVLIGPKGEFLGRDLSRKEVRRIVSAAQE